jgi:isopentenyl-diphosphate Delta-isomerase
VTRVLGAVDALPGVHGIGTAGETGLERFRLSHRALPGRDLCEVSLRTRLLGAELAAPVVVWGDDRSLARAACEHGVGLVSGVQTPDRPPLWLARVDLGGTTDLDADGFVIELGDGGRGAIEAVATAVERFAPLPVVVSGAGLGLDAADVRELRAVGVAAVDVGGSAGRWGVPTADAVAEAVLVGGLPVLGGGGLRDGLDAAKCLALGADAVSFEWPPDLEVLVHELRVAVWRAGVSTPLALTPGHLRTAL